MHQVTVIAYPRYRDEVNAWLEANPDTCLDIRWLGMASKSASATEKASSIPRELAMASHYVRWLRMVEDLAAQLIRSDAFDFIQLVSYGTLSAPVRLWNLGVPFILGPIGGGQKTGSEYQHLIGRLPVIARIRNWRISLLHLHPAIRQMLRNCALVLVTNRETSAIVESCGGKSTTFSDTGIGQNLLRVQPLNRQFGPGLKMLWVGRMIYRKALPLVFHAMKAAGRADIKLEIAGSGPMLTAWRNLVTLLGLDKQVVFRGEVSFGEVFELYDQADLLVFPSVSDSFGSQLIEAASRGLPILTLDHQGAGTLLPSEAAWKVPVDGAEAVVQGLARAMVFLADHPDRLRSMSEAALAYAQTESWPVRAERMTAIYNQLTSGCRPAKEMEAIPTRLDPV
jgi:glycosyltransferase involved in cell wall biosynthesis